MLRRLPTAIDVTADDLLSMDTVKGLQKKVVSIVDADLQHDIDTLVKTHMLRNRVETGETDAKALVTRRLRHYLVMVAVPSHRKAITGLLLGDHNLSVERLRYPPRYRDAVPRHLRLCRFCRNGVEDEVHALFDCAGEAQLIDLRADFLRALACSDGAVWELYTTIPNYEFMLKLVASRKAVQLFAKFIFLVLELFQTAPRFFPVVFRTLEQ